MTRHTHRERLAKCQQRLPASLGIGEVKYSSSARQSVEATAEIFRAGCMRRMAEAHYSLRQPAATIEAPARAYRVVAPHRALTSHAPLLKLERLARGLETRSVKLSAVVRVTKWA